MSTDELAIKRKLDNSLCLLSVLKRKDRRDEDSGTYLDNWTSDCGTYKCVAGDYVSARYGIKDPDLITKNSRFIHLTFNSEFGSPERFYREGKECNVFGSYGWGTIKQRIKYVEFKIQELREWGVLL